MISTFFINSHWDDLFLLRYPSSPLLFQSLICSPGSPVSLSSYSFVSTPHFSGFVLFTLCSEEVVPLLRALEGMSLCPLGWPSGLGRLDKALSLPLSSWREGMFARLPYHFFSSCSCGRGFIRMLRGSDGGRRHQTLLPCVRWAGFPSAVL